ncbi:hypothetical protein KCP73_09215 [Salmonella enterica subsp. enterica]|nr:hypothetical protein KCP73_09215 [Salmonella enterica subsp. enterica]
MGYDVGGDIELGKYTLYTITKTKSVFWCCILALGWNVKLVKYWLLSAAGTAGVRCW